MKGVREGLALGVGIELLAVGQLADVTHGDALAALGNRALADFDVFNHQTGRELLLFQLGLLLNGFSLGLLGFSGLFRGRLGRALLGVLLLRLLDFLGLWLLFRLLLLLLGRLLLFTLLLGNLGSAKKSIKLKINSY
jgi:hypothetical protein